jgi:hypothetical protein
MSPARHHRSRPRIDGRRGDHAHSGRSEPRGLSR